MDRKQEEDEEVRKEEEEEEGGNVWGVTSFHLRTVHSWRWTESLAVTAEGEKKKKLHWTFWSRNRSAYITWEVLGLRITGQWSDLESELDMPFCFSQGKKKTPKNKSFWAEPIWYRLQLRLEFPRAPNKDNMSCSPRLRLCSDAIKVFQDE